jgi:molybdopterin molybdotransferase
MELEEARRILLNIARPCPVEQIDLERCWNRILAEDVAADTDFPPFNRSPLDGYAVVSRDVAEATFDCPVVLEQIDYAPAGCVAQRTVVPGTAVRIMTGAPIPTGADGVVRLEDSECDGTRIKILAGTGVDKNICHKGEEIKLGETVLHQGSILNAGCMGILAMVGRSTPTVYKRPKVAILATGSEIIDVDQALVPGKIRNSNNFMLLSQIREAGGEPVVLGKVEDNLEAILDRLKHAPLCDIYITTGGASAGDYDLMPQVLKQLGIQTIFDRIAIKPGMPALAGLWKDSLLVALSGNPAAASVTFEVLIRPVIRKLGGYQNLWRTSISAVLQDKFNKPSTYRRFVWAQCYYDSRGWRVAPLYYQGNGMLKSMTMANALIDIPAHSPSLTPGAEVKVLLLTSDITQ